jgi:hypothetical protein
MKVISYIAIGLLIIIASFFLYRGCGQGKAVQAIQDSLNVERALNDSIKLQANRVAKSNDSILVKNSKDSVKYIFKIDSLTRIVQTLKGQFKVTKDSIGTLYGQLKTFYLNKDTIDLVNTYNQLYTQLTEANQQLFEISLTRDSVDHANAEEIARLNGVILVLRKQIVEYISLLRDCTANADSLAKNGNLAVKRAKSAGLFSKIEAALAAIVIALLLVAHK